ncbi:MAG: hypothetical protein ACREIV_01230, partial [Planctomycetaceae bacterium]
GLVEALQESETTAELRSFSPKQFESETSFDAIWFRLTEKGRGVWSEWEPPMPEGDKNGPSRTT